MRTYTADEVDAMIGKALARERERVAQQQEPVAWICEGSSSDEKHAIDYWPGNVDDLPIGTQLYTSPPAQRTWVGLKDEQWQSIADTLGCIITRGQKDAIEAKLRERNT